MGLIQFGLRFHYDVKITARETEIPRKNPLVVCAAFWAEVGTICAAPALDGAWLRAEVNRHFEETGEVELRYVDYGGYDRVKINQLRKIRSDFLSLPFQATEVLLDNVVPLADEDHFSPQADAAVAEMTKGAVLVAQATDYDSATGLPLVELWNLMGDEVRLVTYLFLQHC
ncbi:A-kinase anchor protein 1, mitochondrial-like [Porphyrio hochstetteri]